MELVKEKWSKKDTQEFDKYLYSIRKEDKIEFTKKTVNTSMTTLGIPTPQLRAIAKEIIKGNYISFLDNDSKPDILFLVSKFILALSISSIDILLLSIYSPFFSNLFYTFLPFAPPKLAEFKIFVSKVNVRFDSVRVRLRARLIILSRSSLYGTPMGSQR